MILLSYFYYGDATPKDLVVFPLLTDSVNKKYSISSKAFIIQNLCWILKETGYVVIERTKVLIWNKCELVMLSLFVLLISKVLVNAHCLAVKFFFLLE